MRKKVDLAKAKQLIKYARSIGVNTKTFWILGYPGESKETMKRTINVAYEMGADWSLFFPATPLPGTDMLRRCQDNGWLADPNLDYRRYFFTANIRTPEFTPDDVLELRDKANQDLNFYNNTNFREGNFAKAEGDFQEVSKLYPNLSIAKEMIEKCRKV